MSRLVWMCGVALCVSVMAGCAIIPLAVSAVVGPLEGRPLVKVNNAGTTPVYKYATPAPMSVATSEAPATDAAQ